MPRQPLVGLGLLSVEVSRSHSRYNTCGRTPLNEWSARRRDLYLTTHNTRDRYPCPGGRRTSNPSKRTAADPHLRPRGHRDRLLILACLHKVQETSSDFAWNAFAEQTWWYDLDCVVPSELSTFLCFHWWSSFGYLHRVVIKCSYVSE
jgi:hypothetical protein